MQSFILTRTAFDDTEQAVAQVEEQGVIRVLHVHDDRQRVAYFDVVDCGKRSSFCSDEAAVDHAAHRPCDIFGGHRLAIVEADAVAEVEDPRQRIGAFPACGEPGLEVEMFVLADEGVVDGCADALGLGVGALAEVEVVGGAFDDEAGEGVVDASGFSEANAVFVRPPATARGAVSEGRASRSCSGMDAR